MSRGVRIAEDVTLFKRMPAEARAARPAAYAAPPLLHAPSAAPPVYARPLLEAPTAPPALALADNVPMSGGVPAIPGRDFYGPAPLHSLAPYEATGGRHMLDALEIGGFEPRSGLVANISTGSGGFTGGTIGAATPDLPAINYVRPSGTRLVTVYHGEPHYRSLGRSPIYLPGSATPITKVEGDFYPFLGIQQARAQISDVELHVVGIQGEVRPVILNTVRKPGYVIKGLYYEDGQFISRVPPSNPALRNANFRMEGDFTEPEQVNQWLMSRGAIPWIDIRHFFSQGF